MQLVQPNLDTLGNIGWCLSFVEDVFGTPHLYATATDGWHSAQFPHTDRNLPDACVPVWFSYFEDGIDYGHVAVYVPGRGVLSSPYKADNSQQWFADIDECARVLNCTYLGWSEDLATILIVREEQDMSDVADRDFVADVAVGMTNLQPEVNQVFLNNIGLPQSQVVKNFLNYSEHKDLLLRAGAYDDLQKQIADLQAQASDLTKKLEIVQAGNGDATRWQTLRTLIKALIS